MQFGVSGSTAFPGLMSPSGPRFRVQGIFGPESRVCRPGKKKPLIDGNPSTKGDQTYRGATLLRNKLRALRGTNIPPTLSRRSERRAILGKPFPHALRDPYAPACLRSGFQRPGLSARPSASFPSLQWFNVLNWRYYIMPRRICQAWNGKITICFACLNREHSSTRQFFPRNGITYCLGPCLLRDRMAHSRLKLCRMLDAMGIHTPGGKNRWRTTTVPRILPNEKHNGDAPLQEAFTADLLTKKRKQNEGAILI